MRYKLLLCVLLSFASAYGAESRQKDSKNLIENVQTLLNFHMEPESPKVGDRPVLLVQVNTTISRNEIVLEATLDDATLKLTNTAGQLWTANLKALSEVKTHTVSVNIFTRDAQQA
ncbi:MAG: hypothetical protein ACXVAX_08400 [Pseudobdellovibrio sp.]